jgi:hypothetical protein
LVLIRPKKESNGNDWGLQKAADFEGQVVVDISTEINKL